MAEMDSSHLQLMLAVLPGQVCSLKQNADLVTCTDSCMDRASLPPSIQCCAENTQHLSAYKSPFI